MIVEKYTKALLDTLKDREEMVEVYEAIARVALISNDPKFILIVKSPLLSIDEKVNFLLEVAESKNEKLKNFFKLLLLNKRVDLIKEIHKNLYAKISNLLNIYAGFVEGKIDEATLKAIEEKLSKKFNADINLQLKEKELNGLKVFIDVLNVEIAVDEKQIKQNLISQILKAI